MAIPYMYYQYEWAHFKSIMGHGATSDECTVDSAFGNVNQEFLIKSSQELIRIQSYRARSISRDATSMRQSAEWGMRAFQSSMPLIKERMKF